MQDPQWDKIKRMQPHYWQWGLTAFCVIVASAVVVFLITWIPNILGFLKRFLGILRPFIYGFVMAYLLVPVFNALLGRLGPYLEKKYPNRGKTIAKGLCSALTLIIGIAVVAALIGLVLPRLLDSVNTLIGSMQSYYATIAKWINMLPIDALRPQGNAELQAGFQKIIDGLTRQMGAWIDGITAQIERLLTGLASTMGIVLDLFVGIIIAMYILNSKDTFCAQAKKLVYSLFSIEHANGIIRRVAHIHRVFGGFILGKLLDSLIIGILCFFGLYGLTAVGLFTFDSSFALLIAVIVGVTNIIPFFGPFIGAIPSTILIFAVNPWQALYFAIFVLALQQFDGNILGPKILGDSTGLSSFWVMFAIIVAGGFFGFIGMAVGVPLFAVIYSLISEGICFLLKKRGLPTDTNAYRGARRLDSATHAFVEVQSESPRVLVKKKTKANPKKQEPPAEGEK